MTRTQLQQLIVVLLLLFVVVWVVTRKTPESPSLHMSPLQPMAAPTLMAQTQGSSPKKPAQSGDLTIARDVFSPPPMLTQKLEQQRQEEAALERQKTPPPVTTTPRESISAQSSIEATNFEVQGIFWGVANPQAIINRQIVSIGDSIDDAKVETITKDGVTLSMDGRTIEIKAESSIRSADDHNKKQGQSQPWSTFNSQ